MVKVWEGGGPQKGTEGIRMVPRLIPPITLHSKVKEEVGKLTRTCSPRSRCPPIHGNPKILLMQGQYILLQYRRTARKRYRLSISLRHASHVPQTLLICLIQTCTVMNNK